MKKLCFIGLLCLFYANECYAQGIYNKEFLFQNNAYGLEVTDTGNGRFNYLIKVYKDTSKLFEFGLVDMEITIFNNKFKDNIQSSLFAGKDTLSGDISILGSNLFSGIVINQKIINNAPIAGTLYCQKSVKVYDSRRKEMRKESYELEVDSIQLEIIEGNIKNLTLTGRKKGTTESMLFYSWWPIAFSGLYDYGFTYSIISSQKVNNYNERDHIYLEDLITYDPKLDLGGEDYSPRAGIYTLVPSKEKNKYLFKEELKRVINAEIYTDLVGVSSDNPNGLVQTEISRKFIINHRKRQTIAMAYMGWFNYVEPQLTLSKIEENNKYLALEELNSVKSLRTTDLRNYQIFSIRAPLNLLAFNYPYYKMASDINVGVGLNRVGISDSVITNSLLEIKNSSISTASLFVEFKHRFNADSRYGLELSVIPEYLNLFSNEHQQVMSFNSETNSQKSKWLLGFQLKGYLRLNENSKAFFRLRSIHQLHDLNTNIFHSQLGYSFDIFKMIKEKKP